MGYVKISETQLNVSRMGGIVEKSVADPIGLNFMAPPASQAAAQEARPSIRMISWFAGT